MCLTMTQVESSFVLVPDASRGSLGSNDLVENFCCTRELYLAREDICVRNNVECLRCLMTCVVVLFSGHGLLTGGSVGLTAPPHTLQDTDQATWQAEWAWMGIHHVPAPPPQNQQIDMCADC
jgi:hypothetical protein